MLLYSISSVLPVSNTISPPRRQYRPSDLDKTPPHRRIYNIAFATLFFFCCLYFKCVCVQKVLYIYILTLP